ncbi:MAG TPA: 6-hydroxymethylpterin diphosphokinase MptE-like protein, partial [Anaerolineales bacterium]|nr:6-hydroxymethylpterin diphosphokinase MptE-like protein [Anaerolineales bacterium]
PIKRIGNYLRLLPDYISWQIDPRGLHYTAQFLLPLKDKYRGCRCIIVGNGPSLQKMDLSTLRDEFTFGSNRIYLLFEQLGFVTDFLVSINRTVLEQFGSDIAQIKTTKFINWRYRSALANDDKTIFLAARPDWSLDGEALKGYFPGIGTVTNVAIEVAFFLGFSEVILIGVDHSYAQKGTPGLTIVSQEGDRNHFSKDYFGKGITWQLPDYQAMEEGYRMAKGLFEKNGRKIVDGTPGGHLEIFQKVNFYDFLQNSPFLNKSSFAAQTAK